MKVTNSESASTVGSGNSSAGLLKCLHETLAAELAEAAIVLPLLFMLLLSIYWFGRAFTAYGTINHAAREAARTASTPACANCTASCLWQSSTLPCDTNVADALNQALIAAHLDPAQAQPLAISPAPQVCPGPPQGACAPDSSNEFTICRNVQLNQGNTASSCGVIISFEYPYQFFIPFSTLSNQTIMLKAQAEMRGED